MRRDKANIRIRLNYDTDAGIRRQGIESSIIEFSKIIMATLWVPVEKKTVCKNTWVV